MQIAIIDNENQRVIVSKVPEYLSEANRSSDDIAEAIFSALGLSVNSTEYMIGNFDVSIDVNVLNGNHGYNHNVDQGIEQLTQDFKTDALQALEDSKD